MKKIALSFILATISLACTNAQKTAFNKESLDQKLTTTDSIEVTFGTILKNQKGKVTVIEIWASWCSDCVKAMPKVKEMQANNPNVDYVFISMDKGFDKWKAGIEKHGLTGKQYWVNDPKMMKGEFGKSIDLDWIPRYIILDKNGKIITYRAIETDFEQINATLKTLQ